MLHRMLTIQLSSPRSFFLFGPRGTGKTSWVKAHFPEALYIDLLSHESYFLLSANPSRLEALVLAHTSSPWIIIDEVQKIPALLDEVHRLIETYQKCFILTGSSSRQLKRGATNLLAGRAFTYHMHPLTAIEIGESFDLELALRYGLLPLSYLQDHSSKFLASYIATYLQEEVMQEGLVRQITAFNRFMEIASFSQGNQLNLLNISREVGVSHKIISGYFDILEDLLISVRIPVFAKRSARKLTQHPKFYYFDVGVFQQLRPKGMLDVPEEIGGAALETLFLQQLRAVIDYCELDLSIYFWRTATGVEVDFIVYGGDGLFAFELKNRRYFNRRDLSSLKIFKNDYPMAKAYLIYTGQHREQHDEIEVWPIREVLFHLITLLKGENIAS